MARVTPSPAVKPNRSWAWIWPYIFLLPFLLVFVLFFVVPFVFDISQSFYTERHAGGLGLTPPKVVWAGFENYAKALTDPDFWDGFRRVLLFGIVQIPLMMALALGIALLMDSAVIRFRRFFRLAAFIPYAVPGVVAAILWSFFYTPTISPITQGLHNLHLGAPDFLGTSTILWSIGNIATWEFTGYNMLIFFAAMQAIPQELYEAARIDGLNEVGIARRIKIPMISPALRLGLLFSMIGTLQLFNEPEILKNVSGAITPTFTPNIFAYNIAIIQTNFYYGGAIAAILGLITFVFSFVFMRFSQR
ncbi:MAG: sugar ABC transporter permease [Ktedonobacterales bacterium]|nr:sugar ABC transporter permease [Ktedonobacterales bacterium]